MRETIIITEEMRKAATRAVRRTAYKSSTETKHGKKTAGKPLSDAEVATITTGKSAIKNRGTVTVG